MTVGDGQGARVAWILDGLQKIARGDYDLEEPDLGADDDIAAISTGLIMVAEELDAQIAENVRLEQALVQEKERTIEAQRAVIEELSTPVLQVGEGILVLPLIGALDTARARVMTERLLESVSRTQATAVIIDITGVPMVDSLVAKYLTTTVEAVRLLGTECLLTGISPAVAETMVRLGSSLEGITCKGTLHTGLQHVLRMGSANGER